MRIALSSKSFLPNVGGIETSTAMIARTWRAAGHEVEVVTATPDPAPPTEPFRVTRAWGPRALAAAVGRRKALAARVKPTPAAVLCQEDARHAVREMKEGPSSRLVGEGFKPS